MKSIREMDEDDRDRIARSGWDESAFAKQQQKKSKDGNKLRASDVKKSVRSSKHLRKSGHGRHQQSIESLDYTLSSSDEENAEEDKAPSRDLSDNLQVVIARDNHDMSPVARTEVSDAKTSDVTKVDHAKDFSGIIHEKLPTAAIDHAIVLPGTVHHHGNSPESARPVSQRLETRSDLSHTPSAHVQKSKQVEFVSEAAAVEEPPAITKPPSL